VLVASHMAATAGEWFDEVIPMLEFGVRSNPGNWLILNNLAFARVMAGRLDEAVDALQLAKSGLSDPVGLGYLAATSGLLAFRLGATEQGRALYRKAQTVFAAAAGDQSENRAGAAVFWAQEEGRLGSAGDKEVIDRGRRMAGEAGKPYLNEVMRRVDLSAGA
jgi:tetratricopeptide (TPR) repeat protein